MDVIVVGGGIVGTSTAVELALRGAKVKLIEKGQIGYGCSYGNAGWMTPCFALPLPMPGLFFKSIKWLLDPESPLYIKPQPSLLMLNWMSRFLASMNETKAQPAIEALVTLSQESLRMYEELSKEYPEIRFEKKGLLMVAKSKEGMAATFDEMNRVAKFGVPGKKLSPEEVFTTEPNLIGEFYGGVYFPDEAMAEPLQVVKALANKARKLGVEITEHCELLDFVVSDQNRISSLATTAGRMTADHYVLTTGSWSYEIAKKINLSVPIMGGKGYSLIVPKLSKQPNLPIMFLEKKIAITPRQDSLRIAGTMEIVNQDFSVTDRRVQAIIKGTRQILDLPQDLHIQELWRGLRPISPDGVPLMGTSNKINNLSLACGHQMLGLQTGIGSGKLLAELILNKKSELNRPIYHPDRF